jgi:NADH-quinone oxidoreductase subunit C
MAQDSTPTTDAPATDDSAEAGEIEQSARDDRREAILTELVAGLGEGVIDTHIDPGIDLWARVSVDAWAEAAEIVRHRMGAKYFGFLSVIDWLPSPFGRSMDSEVDNLLGVSEDETETDDEAAAMQHGVTGGETRFQVFARVASVGDPENFWGITLKADIPDSLDVPTWTNTYAGADWHEREAWEMYGINFVGHPGLRHIYLPGDFEGNPLRKDYPLIARMVKPWPGIVDVEPLPEADDGSAGEASSDNPAGSQPPSAGEASSDNPAGSQPSSSEDPA